MDRAIAFLKAILPYLKMLAAITPSTSDDAIVAILEALVNKPQNAQAAVAALKEKGLV